MAQHEGDGEVPFSAVLPKRRPFTEEHVLPVSVDKVLQGATVNESHDVKLEFKVDEASRAEFTEFKAGGAGGRRLGLRCLFSRLLSLSLIFSDFSKENVVFGGILFWSFVSLSEEPCGDKELSCVRYNEKSTRSIWDEFSVIKKNKY